jgi:ABC-type sugar transport system ATPase subunit
VTVRLCDVSKFHGSTRVLDGISVEIPQGQSIVLTGPSGSGKTTLLRILAGLEPPTSGRVEFDGRDVTRLGPRERGASGGVAMVFQDYPAYPRLTVRENLHCVLRSLQLRGDASQPRLAQIARQFGLDPFLDRLPSQLSGGQLQRLALARAVLRRPSLLLLDEPLSQLDLLLTEQLRTLLAEIRVKDPMTIIMVSHDPADAFAKDSQLLILEQGRLIHFGPAALEALPPESLPQTAFARALLDRRPPRSS